MEGEKRGGTFFHRRVLSAGTERKPRGGVGREKGWGK